MSEQDDCKCQKHGRHEICGNDCICRNTEVDETIHLQSSTDTEQNKKIAIVKQIVDNAVDEKLKPLEAQIQQLPQLIQGIVQQALAPYIQQDAAVPQVQPTQYQQTQDPNADKMKALEGLVPIIQGLAPMFGLGQPAQNTGGNAAIMDMIVQSYMKKMQMDIDAQFMQTYQAPANIPTWANSPANPAQQPQAPPHPRVRVE